MKMVKNIAIVACAASFMFASVSFHMANNYTDMDASTTVASSWGATFDLNDQTSVGYDSALGMLMYFEAPLGVTLRLGWSETNSTTSVGMGFTWWSGGDLICTRTFLVTGYRYTYINIKIIVSSYIYDTVGFFICAIDARRYIR